MLMGASGIGAVVGALFLASRQKVLGIKKIIALCSIISSICIFIFAFSKLYFLSMSLLVVIGFCSIIIISGSNTAMQAMSPDRLRGRIVGLFSMMFMGVFPLGSLSVGFLAHLLGAPKAVSIGAVVCFIMAIYFSTKVPKLTKQAKELICTQDKINLLAEGQSYSS
jgi:MFS family permease